MEPIPSTSENGSTLGVVLGEGGGGGGGAAPTTHPF